MDSTTETTVKEKSSKYAEQLEQIKRMQQAMISELAAKKAHVRQQESTLINLESEIRKCKVTRSENKKKKERLLLEIEEGQRRDATEDQLRMSRRREIQTLEQVYKMKKALLEEEERVTITFENNCTQMVNECQAELEEVLEYCQKDPRRKAAMKLEEEAAAKAKIISELKSRHERLLAEEFKLKCELSKRRSDAQQYPFIQTICEFASNMLKAKKLYDQNVKNAEENETLEKVKKIRMEEKRRKLDSETNDTARIQRLLNSTCIGIAKPMTHQQSNEKNLTNSTYFAMLDKLVTHEAPRSPYFNNPQHPAGAAQEPQNTRPTPTPSNTYNPRTTIFRQQQSITRPVMTVPRPHFSIAPVAVARPQVTSQLTTQSPQGEPQTSQCSVNQTDDKERSQNNISEEARRENISKPNNATEQRQCLATIPTQPTIIEVEHEDNISETVSQNSSVDISVLYDNFKKAMPNTPEFTYTKREMFINGSNSNTLELSNQLNHPSPFLQSQMIRPALPTQQTSQSNTLVNKSNGPSTSSQNRVENHSNSQQHAEIISDNQTPTVTPSDQIPRNSPNDASVMTLHQFAPTSPIASTSSVIPPAPVPRVFTANATPTPDHTQQEPTMQKNERSNDERPEPEPMQEEQPLVLETSIVAGGGYFNAPNSILYDESFLSDNNNLEKELFMRFDDDDFDTAGNSNEGGGNENNNDPFNLFGNPNDNRTDTGNDVGFTFEFNLDTEKKDNGLNRFPFF